MPDPEKLSYRELLQKGTEDLKEHGIEEAGTDAWLLLSYAAGISRTDYLLRAGETPDEKVRSLFETLLKKRGEHVPCQYLTGTQDFYGFSFRVDERVLIPRQDTECLVEKAEKYIHEGERVLDLCTGSGCIAITLKKLHPDASVFASDLSEAALCVARENAQNLGSEVSFLQSDLFEEIEGSFDLIISNPPYIPSRTVDTLSLEVRGHEPRIALDGFADGLFFYRKIVKEGFLRLNPGGWLFFEIGFDQGEALKSLLSEAGFEHITIEKDLAGLDRIAAGCRPV